MELLGAQKFYHRGEADDATSLELVVEPWLEGLQQEMRDMWDKIRSFTPEQLEEVQRPCEDQQTTKTQVVKKDEEVVEEIEEVKSTQITFYGKITSVQLLNPNSSQKYEGGKEVFHVSVEYPRKIDKDKIDVGQSVAIFPQNLDEDAMTCVEAFGWKKDDLLGNYTVR